LTYLWHICNTQNHLPICIWGRWFRGMHFLYNSVTNMWDIDRSHGHLRLAARNSPLQLCLTWFPWTHGNLTTFLWKNIDRFYSVHKLVYIFFADICKFQLITGRCALGSRNFRRRWAGLCLGWCRGSDRSLRQGLVVWRSERKDWLVSFLVRYGRKQLMINLH